MLKVVYMVLQMLRISSRITEIVVPAKMPFRYGFRYEILVAIIVNSTSLAGIALPGDTSSLWAMGGLTKRHELLFDATSCMSSQKNE